ncbi:MAG: hypothetical protein V1875_09395 [Candidatus Altiarchaeota archaeon]
MTNALWLAAAAILLMSGCISKDPAKLATEALNKTDTAICDSISDYRMRYNCSMRIAVSQDNTTICGAIESEDWKNDCYATIAAKRRDVRVCDDIRSVVQRDGCYRKVAGAT